MVGCMEGGPETDGARKDLDTQLSGYLGSSEPLDFGPSFEKALVVCTSPVVTANLLSNEFRKDNVYRWIGSFVVPKVAVFRARNSTQTKAGPRLARPRFEECQSALGRQFAYDLQYVSPAIEESSVSAVSVLFRNRRRDAELFQPAVIDRSSDNPTDAFGKDEF
jgi:hypothetical protein